MPFTILARSPDLRVDNTPTYVSPRGKGGEATAAELQRLDAAWPATHAHLISHGCSTDWLASRCQVSRCVVAAYLQGKGAYRSGTFWRIVVPGRVNTFRPM